MQDMGPFEILNKYVQTHLKYQILDIMKKNAQKGKYIKYGALNSLNTQKRLNTRHYTKFWRQKYLILNTKKNSTKT